MLKTAPQSREFPGFPLWLPEATRHYLIHTECGVSIRKLARDAGCHASTVLRQIRKTETRRDDPLLDDALARLGALHSDTYGGNHSINPNLIKDDQPMNVQLRTLDITPDTTSIEREARRILRRLCEPGACLAVATEMDKAVVVRETDDGRTVRTAVTDRHFVHAMVLKDWISSAAQGRISRYNITTTGRAALKRLLAEDEAERVEKTDEPHTFTGPRRQWDDGQTGDADAGKSHRIRYNLAESPVASMARRKDRNGAPFLSGELVAAAERLREDYELAQMATRTSQSWESFLTGDGADEATGHKSDNSSAARDRVGGALRDLGPGLGDVALRVCCFLEGLETAEKRMGWSARSGKVVLRIALQRLKQHYDGLGKYALIG
ncbi:MAG: DUF6456 domain-containing protein [Paracoccaceae bacterium]